MQRSFVAPRTRSDRGRECHTFFSLQQLNSLQHRSSSPSFLVEVNRHDQIEKMPIGKIGGYSGKGGDYSAGNVNLTHTTSQSKPRVLVQTAS